MYFLIQNIFLKLMYVVAYIIKLRVNILIILTFSWEGFVLTTSECNQSRFVHHVSVVHEDHSYHIIRENALKEWRWIRNLINKKVHLLFCFWYLKRVRSTNRGHPEVSCRWLRRFLLGFLLLLIIFFLIELSGHDSLALIPNRVGSYSHWGHRISEAQKGLTSTRGKEL